MEFSVLQNKKPGCCQPGFPYSYQVNRLEVALDTYAEVVDLEATNFFVVVAEAHNEPRTLTDPTAHAEVLAIRRAAQALGNERLEDCDLYVTLEPCAMCAAAISFARIRRLYYGARDKKGGAVEHGPRFFHQPTCHHAPDVYSGFLEEEAASLLRDFFASRR